MLPKKLALEDAYRNNPYNADIVIGVIDEKPKVEAKFYEKAGAKLLVEKLQPDELEVVKKDEATNTWIAKLAIPDCKPFPSSIYFEIYVNGIVKFAGNLNVGYTLR